MSKRKRAIAKCPEEQQPAKLIVRVVDHKNKPVNGVKVFAVPKDEGEQLTHRTEPLYKHVKPAWKKLGKFSDPLDGVAHFGKNVPPGKYNVSVYSEPGEKKKEVKVIENEGGRTRRKPHATLKLHALLMVLDADRDGKVDLEPLTATDHEEWTWGADGEGAVVMVKTRTYQDGHDVDERSKISFKWTGPADEGWEDLAATLKFEPHQNLRIYSSKQWKADEANRVFDGETDTLDLKEVPGAENGFQNEQQIDLWLEAKDFPSSADGSDAEIKLTYSFQVGEGPAFSQTAKVRIAPWIMAGDYDSVERVYIVNFPVNRVANKWMKNGTKAVLNADLRQEVDNLIEPSLSLITPPVSSSGALHRYARDMMRFGTHSAPGNVGNPVALRGNQTSLSNFHTRPDMDCVAKGIGVVERPRAGDASNSDCGGNLVLSPPVQGVDGPTHPFGRIIYSHSIHKDMGASWRDFFAAQRIQAPIRIDTSWLSCGHADEVVAFVPANTSGRPYRMLLASPRRAYQILGNIDLDAVAELRNQQVQAGLPDDATHVAWNVLSAGPGPVDFRAREAGQGAMVADLQNGNGRLCFNRFQHFGNLFQKWIDQFLQDDAVLSQNDGSMADKIATVFGAASEVAGDLARDCTWGDVVPALQAKAVIGQDTAPPVFIQLAVQVMLDHIRDKLKEELAIGDADVVEVPILYNPSTGNMVNLLLVGKTCVVPKPYGPLMDGRDLFEEAFKTDLAGIGLDIHFINEWHEYHLDGGEIHCGTNQCPTNKSARDKQWWLQRPQGL